jgi:transposase
LKLPGFLWTRALVCDLVAQQFGIEVGEDTCGRYLRAWGFSPQKVQSAEADASRLRAVR